MKDRPSRTPEPRRPESEEWTTHPCWSWRWSSTSSGSPNLFRRPRPSRYPSCLEGTEGTRGPVVGGSGPGRRGKPEGSWEGRGTYEVVGVWRPTREGRTEGRRVARQVPGRCLHRHSNPQGEQTEWGVGVLGLTHTGEGPSEGTDGVPVRARCPPRPDVF